MLPEYMLSDLPAGRSADVAQMDAPGPMGRQAFGHWFYRRHARAMPVCCALRRTARIPCARARSLPSGVRMPRACASWRTAYGNDGGHNGYARKRAG